jgi:hypothetical protein
MITIIQSIIFVILFFTFGTETGIILALLFMGCIGIFHLGSWFGVVLLGFILFGFREIDDRKELQERKERQKKQEEYEARHRNR